MRRLRTLVVGVAVPLVVMGMSTATAHAGLSGWIPNSTGEPGGPTWVSGQTYMTTPWGAIDCAKDVAFDGSWVFSECLPEGGPTKAACTTPGYEEGEIVTSPLEVSYAAINKEIPTVGIEVKPVEGLFTTFECGKVSFEVRGAVIGEVTPLLTLVKPPESYTAVFGLSEGHQAVTKFEGGMPTQLEFKVTEGESEGKYSPGAIESVEAISYEELTELHPVIEE
jgi:hypothetical protein